MPYQRSLVQGLKAGSKGNEQAALNGIAAAIGHRMQDDALSGGQSGNHLRLRTVLMADFHLAQLRPAVVPDEHPGIGVSRRQPAPFAADQQVGQVVAHDVLHDLAARLHDVAVGEHGLESQHVLLGRPVLECARTAGAFRDVAAERRLPEAGGIGRIEQPDFLDGVLQVVEYRPALHSAPAKPEPVAPVPSSRPEAPPRVQQWKNALLDLSLRNRLINYTERSGLALAVPDSALGALETSGPYEPYAPESFGFVAINLATLFAAIILFAGFLLAEDVIRSADEIGAIEYCQDTTDEGRNNTINVTTTTATPVLVNAANGTDTINVNETVNNGAVTIGPSTGSLAAHA